MIIMESKKRTKLLRIARFVYLTALLIAIVVLLAIGWTDIVALLQETRLLLLLVALAFSFGLIWLGSYFWMLGLKTFGHTLPLHEIVVATARALPARYVPIGAGLTVGRVALLRTAGVKATPLAATALLEMIVSLAVALTLGSITLWATSTGVNTDILPDIANIAMRVAPLLVLSVTAILIVFPRVCQVLSRKMKHREAVLSVGWRSWLCLVAASALYWTWNSVTFVVYLRAFSAADSISAIAAAGAFMFSWGVGFLTVFAPQGIGITEASLLALLTHEDSGFIGLTIIFASYRLIQLLRDIVAVIAGETFAALKRKTTNQQR